MGTYKFTEIISELTEDMQPEAKRKLTIASTIFGIFLCSSIGYTCFIVLKALNSLHITTSMIERNHRAIIRLVQMKNERETLVQSIFEKIGILNLTESGPIIIENVANQFGISADLRKLGYH